MKEVYILRHANWDNSQDQLTEQGIEAARKYSASLPNFTIVEASLFQRAQQTAELLSGVKPKEEPGASILQASDDVRAKVLERRETNPFGIAGALFETQEAWPALKRAGDGLVQAIKKALDELGDNQRALIISHDGTMMAAERILKNEPFENPIDHTYSELEGYIVDSDLRVRLLNEL